MASWRTRGENSGTAGSRHASLRAFRHAAAALLALTSAACGSSSSTTPGDVGATPLDSSTRVSWSAVDNATAYNVYWATQPGVTTSNGTRIANVQSPVLHGGIVNGHAYYYIVTAITADGEGPASDETSATPVYGVTREDPFYGDQWNLKNIGSNLVGVFTGGSGEDINVEPAWDACGHGQVGCRGEGVRVSVVDDGLEIGHEDLAVNIASGQSYNYVDGGTDPSGGFHGTSVAGLIAARDLNGLGIRGVAPRANLVAYNLLAVSTSSSVEADAVSRDAANVGVSNNSWGPTDGLGYLESSPYAWKSAINTGLAFGRHGLGTIYVWAAGNGAGGYIDSQQRLFCSDCTDNSNYDGYANYRGVMAVGAVDMLGHKADYSEQGANIWLSAPGGEFCDTSNLAVTTVDRTGSLGFQRYYPTADYNSDSDYYHNGNYTRCMNGTSAATPQVAGVAALVVQANPKLTWRDVRWILAESARVNDASDADWITNAAFRSVNHKYGFGVVDAAAAVNLALGWTNVPAQKVVTVPLHTPNLAIPDATGGTPGTAPPVPPTPGAAVSDSVSLSGTGLSRIEWIEVSFTAADHPYSGDLRIELSHSGSLATSRLADMHICTSGNCDPYNGWIFGDAHHLGESADGTWTVTVTDMNNAGSNGGGTGTFQSWNMKIYGY